MLSLAGQIYALAMMLLAGALVGLLFDIYRVLRSLMRPRTLATIVMDLLFWALATPLVFGLLVIGNWGELRFFVLLGLFCGLFAYFQILSPLVLWLLVTLCRWWGQSLGWCAYTLGALIGWPWRAALAVGQRLPQSARAGWPWARWPSLSRGRAALLWHSGRRPGRGPGVNWISSGRNFWRPRR